jgi:mono/diheme cytochrome c family protein
LRRFWVVTLLYQFITMTTKSFITASFFSLLFFFAVAQNTGGISGKAIFDDKCAKCHGEDGTRGKWGAKNLQKSRLADEDLMKIVLEGKNFMPSWKKRLSGLELKQVTDYVRTLRK